MVKNLLESHGCLCSPLCQDMHISNPTKLHNIMSTAHQRAHIWVVFHLVVIKIDHNRLIMIMTLYLHAL